MNDEAKTPDSDLSPGPWRVAEDGRSIHVPRPVRLQGLTGEPMERCLAICWGSRADTTAMAAAAELQAACNRVLRASASGQPLTAECVDAVRAAYLKSKGAVT